MAAACEPALRAEAQDGIERRPGDADLFVRGRDLPLGRGDVGPSLQQRRRKADQHGRRRRLVPVRQASTTRTAACPSARRSHVRIASRCNAQVDQLRAGGFQLRLRQGHVAHRGDTALVPILGQLHILLVRLHGGVEQPPLARRAPAAGSSRRRAPTGRAGGHSRGLPPTPARRRRWRRRCAGCFPRRRPDRSHRSGSCRGAHVRQPRPLPERGRGGRWRSRRETDPPGRRARRRAAARNCASAASTFWLEMLTCSSSASSCGSLIHAPPRAARRSVVGLRVRPAGRQRLLERRRGRNAGTHGSSDRWRRRSQHQHAERRDARSTRAGARFIHSAAPRSDSGTPPSAPGSSQRTRRPARRTETTSGPTAD